MDFVLVWSENEQSSFDRGHRGGSSGITVVSIVSEVSIFWHGHLIAAAM